MHVQDREGEGHSGTLTPGGQGSPSHRRMSTRVSNLIVSEHSSGHSYLFSWLVVYLLACFFF